MASEYCPLCDADVSIGYEARTAACPECEARFTVDYDMDGPELSWDDEAPQTPKATAALAEFKAERAAYGARMAAVWDAAEDVREDLRLNREYAADAGGFYERCAAEHRALLKLRASKAWTEEETRFLNREIDLAANTGD